MSREKLAQAFDAFAEAAASVAHELRASDAAGTEVPSTASVPAPTRSQEDDLPLMTADIDKSRCPSHLREWNTGKFGAYCSSRSDDPVWSKANKKTGDTYCSITPENAPEWLRIHGLQAA
jgi:hypothetical protein